MIHCCTAAIIYFRSERNIELKNNIDIIERVNYLIQKNSGRTQCFRKNNLDENFHPKICDS